MRSRREPDEPSPWMVEDDEGLTLYIIVQPDGVDTRYMGIDGSYLKFQVALSDVATSATNRLICECLAALLRVEPASVEIVGGSHTAKKVVRIPNLAGKILRFRLGI